MAQKVFIIGGESEEAETENTVWGCDHFEKYCSNDIDISDWKELSPMSSKKAYFGGAVVDYNIYICGGCNRQCQAVTTEMQVFNTSKNSWQSLQPMPEPRDSIGVAALRGYIYVSGGRDVTGEAVSNVYRYCIKTDRWDEVKSMPLSKYAHRLVALNGYLYSVGGYSTKTAYRYNAATDNWTDLEDSMFEHPYPGVTTYDGKIFVHSSKGFEVYSPETNTWVGYKPAHALFASSLVTFGDKIYSIGGCDAGNPTDTVFEYDPVKQQWTELNGTYTTQRGHGLFVVDC